MNSLLSDYQQQLIVDFLDKKPRSASFAYKYGEVDDSGISVQMMNIDQGGAIGVVHVTAPDETLYDPIAATIIQGVATFVLPIDQPGIYSFELVILNANGTAKSSTYQYEVYPSLSTGTFSADVEAYQTLYETMFAKITLWEIQENERVVAEKARETKFTILAGDMEDLIADFHTLSGQQQLDNEVIMARKGKPSLRAKIDEIDNVKFDSVEKEQTEEGTIVRFIANTVPIAEILVEGGGSGGGGGGGNGSIVTLTSEFGENLTYAHGSDIVITYNYDTTLDLDGTYTLKINGAIVKTGIAKLGLNTVDLTQVVSKGINEVTIEVIDPYRSKGVITFYVDAIELSISSKFNNKVAYSSNIPFTYTPVGNLSKVIHFKIDGVEVATEVVTTTGLQLTKTLSKLSHGVHTLEVYSTATLAGQSIRSNTLKLELMCVDASNTNRLIWTDFEPVSVAQYTPIVVPYIVYDPVLLTAPVEFFVNGTKVSEATVDRSLKQWVITDYPSGLLTLKIKSGVIERVFTQTVSEVQFDLEPETLNLDFHLSSTNRSNADTNKHIWSNSGITAVLQGFNWRSDGWLPTSDADPSIALTIRDGATVEIPFKPFQNDPKISGRTIEFDFKVSDVTNYDAVVITCMSGGRGFEITTKSALFKSNEISVKTLFKDDERIRVSFVIESTADHSLVLTYINGIISRIDRYQSSDIFTQQTPVTIKIGSASATVRLYNIRSYGRAVTTRKMLDNYIYDLSRIEDKLRLVQENNIYDAYGEIMYTRLYDQIPVMTWIGELPPVKDDVKFLKMKFENKFDPSRNFEATNVEFDVQGTSSQYYPKKNYKFKLDKTTTPKYQLRPDSIGERKFTVKADYMESSHAHNTGFAKWVNTVYEELVPPQSVNSRVRVAIDGYPMAVFHKENDNAPAKYFGIYNFNIDKKADDTFGAAVGFLEGWEVTNNASDRCIFNISEYSQLDPFTGQPAWMIDFEMRHGEDETDYTNLKRLTDWIVSCKGNPTKFAAEVDQYFNRHYLIMYYLLSEVFAMVDSRAKNLFLNTYDGTIWYPVFFDADTMMGLNNEGVLDFDYYVEGNDTIGSLNVYNGKNSELWKNVEIVFEAEIKAMYKKLRDDNRLSYETMHRVFIEEQIDRICAAQYNEDALYKYLEPVYQENNSTFLYVAQGSRLNFMKYWLYNRFNYLDSKYIASDYLSKYVTMRLYTPSSWGGIAPSGNFSITPFADQYIGVLYSKSMVHSRAKANVAKTITAPSGLTFNDTETIIYGADRILSLGNLANKYAGTVDITQATKLTEIILGSSVSGYVNTNLRILSARNNALLRKIDVTNCPNLTGSLDLKESAIGVGCPSIEEIHAKGSGLTSIAFSSQGANLKKLYLPATITALELINKPLLTEVTLDAYSNLNTLKVDNVGFNPLSIVALSPNLQRVRLLNLNVRSNTLAIDNLLKAQGVDEQGNTVAIGQAVSGKITLIACSSELEAYYKQQLPNVTFIVETYLRSFTVTFTDGDGNVLETKQVIENGEAVYTGGVTPTKTSTAQYSYTFDGWIGYGFNPIKPIVSNTTVQAQFTSTVRSYVIRYEDSLGTLLKTETLTYGSTPTPPAYPSGDNEWFPFISSVVGAQTYRSYYEVDTPDLSIFSFTSTTVNGVAGYYASYASGKTLPNSLILPRKYLNKPVFYTQGGGTAVVTGVQSVKVPITYTKLGTSLFSGMTGLTGNLDLSESKQLTSAGNDCFKNCSGLTGVILPPSLTILGDNCFFGCSGFTSVAIPNTVTSIGRGCFESCSNLDTVTIPNSVTRIEDRCFQSCSKLTSITIPNSVTSIGGNAFFDCSALTNITLPDSITSVGVGCFYQCTGLTSFTIPNSVTRIEDRCFQSCSKLTSITIPNSVTSLGTSCFSQCTGLTSITIPNSVTSLGSSCFSYCSVLTSITIPNSVTSLGDSCFSSCTGLTSITIPNSVTSIGGNAFYNCSALTNITLPDSITSVGVGCFYGCRKLTDFIIPPAVTSLGTSCFSQCTGLTSITIPNSVTSLGDSCFSSCTGLTSITIPNSVTSLGSSCFSSCSNLASISLSNNLVSIGTQCFSDCSVLQGLTIPDSVTTIGNRILFSTGKNSSTGEFNLVVGKGLSSMSNNIVYALSYGSGVPWNITFLGDTVFSEAIQGYTSIKLPIKSLQFGSPGTPVTTTGSWLSTTLSNLSFTGSSPVKIYTSTGTNSGIVGQPWGATGATFTYVQA